MSTMLRSSKLVRYFAGFTRNLIFNSVRGNEGSFVQINSAYVCNNLTHGFATVAASKTDQSLEKSLKRLDHDVRRTGRISRRDIEEVLDEIRLHRSATSSQSLLVIRCCGNLVPEELPEVRTALVQEIWKTLNSLNVPMDISHFNALLRVYLENDHQFSPTDFLTDLESKGIEPNRVTYQRLITRYCQQGDIDGATRILEYMREKSLPVNENVFNSLILGHSEANDLQSAAGIIPVMKQAGLDPSADTYTTLLCCYARHGKVEEILRTLDECEEKEIFLLDKDILDIIYAMVCSGNDGANVDSLLNRIRKSAGYNQDAVNTILRLTNKGHEDIAFKILKTMPRGTRLDGQQTDTGIFFIRQMVKAKRPLEKILKICNQMQSENLNTRALLIATESSLDNGMIDSAMTLLKEMKTAGLPIRQHYFWPLICSADQPADIIAVLKNMQDEFQIHPSSETLRDYVIPNLNEKKWDKIVSLLTDVGIGTATVASSSAYSALMKNNMKEAANIMQQYRSFYSPYLFKKPAISALGKTEDFDSFIKIVRQIYDNIERKQSDDTETEPVSEEGNDEQQKIYKQNEMDAPNFLGSIVYDCVSYFKNKRVEMMEKILQGLVDQGLTINNQSAEKIQERLSAEMTTKISELLEKLSSGELEPIELAYRRKGNFDTMSIERLEKMISNTESKGENAKGLKRFLLNACLRDKDITKMEDVMKNLEAENFEISGGKMAQFIDLYTHNGKLAEALEIFEKVKQKDPEFHLDNFKIVRLCELFLKEDKFEEAIDFLIKNKKDDLNATNSFVYTTTCWRILNSLADKGNVENLQKMFNALKENNYMEPNNVALGPLVKVHIVNNDLKSAVDAFESMCNEYKSTPWKNELACRLIQAEDAANLQRLTDLSTNIHGEVNSLYDLVFSFVECGRVRQARKILETPGLRHRPQRINMACERYRQEGMVEPLEGLIEATKHINHIDQNEMYLNLLLTYCKDDNPEKALGLWTKMQEDNVAPSDEFLNKLANFLKQKNLEIPFVVPEVKKTKAIEVESYTKENKNIKDVKNDKDVKNVKDIKKVEKNEAPESLQSFRRFIRTEDVDGALEVKRQMKSGENLRITDQSHLIELLVKAGRLTEATKCVDELLTQNQHPVPRIFKFYLNKLVNSGDIETIDRIGTQISNEVKKLISFDNRLCHAHFSAGKIDTYFDVLDKDISNAKTTEEIQAVGDKFPRGAAPGVLSSNVASIPKFAQIAEKFANKGIISPMNVLWIHYFIEGNEQEAKLIWEKHLKDSPRLMFQRVLQTARDNKNEQLTGNLIKCLKESKTSEGALGNAYSCYLDILSAKEKYSEGLDILKKGIEDVCLENINRTALLRLKDGLEKQGKEFPFKIPEKNIKNNASSSSSSSSSSDDDVTPKTPETTPKPPTQIA